MKKILIIDDSKVMRDMLKDFLTDEGFEVYTTEDSQEGIDIAISGDFEICICDIHLPKKNGYEIFKEVSTQNQHMQFILTDSLPDHLYEQARQAGAYFHLKKPFDLDQLRETLHKINSAVKQYE